MTDEYFMHMVLQLAKRGSGLVTPNPLVGAVIVKGQKIVAQGWHRKHGDIHAELSALQQLSSARGFTLYCNLEPCAGPWEGKSQPSCAREIVEAGIRRVVIGELDPYAKVSGKGVDILRSAGITVQVGVLESEARRLNETYHHFLATSRPFVHLKAAISLDGFLATSKGDSAWISSRRSRREVHRMRASYDGVLVGSGTVMRDDPLLTVRHVRGRNPRRFVLCSNPSVLANDSKLFHTAEAATTVFVSDRFRLSHLPSGVEVVACPTESENPSLPYVLQWMGLQKVTSLLVEGGLSVFTSFIKNQLWDKMTLYIAPLLIGGGKSLLSDIGVRHISDACRYHAHWGVSGEDRRVTIYRKELKDGNDV